MFKKVLLMASVLSFWERNKGCGLLKQIISLEIRAVFHKIYLVLSWILYLNCLWASCENTGESSYKQIVGSIIKKSLTWKVLLIATAVAWKTRRLWGVKQVITRSPSTHTNRYAASRLLSWPKRTNNWCARLRGYYWKKVYDSTLKTFLSLLWKSHVYSFLLVAFIINISTASSFNRTSIICYQKTFLNCLVCLSSRADWSQAPLTSFVSKLPTLSSQTKQVDDLIPYLKLKALQTFFCNQENVSSFDTLLVNRHLFRGD